MVLALGGDIDEVIERTYKSLPQDQSPFALGASASSALPWHESNELHEGNTRVRVQTTGPVRRLVSFVRELRDTHQLRLLRLQSQTPSNIEILLDLREPSNLERLLAQIPGVSEVNAAPSQDPRDHEYRLLVRLEEEPYRD